MIALVLLSHGELPEGAGTGIAAPAAVFRRPGRRLPSPSRDHRRRLPQRLRPRARQLEWPAHRARTPASPHHSVTVHRRSHALPVLVFVTAAEACALTRVPSCATGSSDSSPLCISVPSTSVIHCCSASGCPTRNCDSLGCSTDTSPTIHRLLLRRPRRPPGRRRGDLSTGLRRVVELRACRPPPIPLRESC